MLYPKYASFQLDRNILNFISDLPQNGKGKYKRRRYQKFIQNFYFTTYILVIYCSSIPPNRFLSHFSLKNGERRIYNRLTDKYYIIKESQMKSFNNIHLRTKIYNEML